MRTASINLGDLLGHAIEAQEERPKIDPEAAVMRLREWGERYAEGLAGPRFAKGDWVTPYPDCAYAGAGNPFLVIEVRHVKCADELPNNMCSCSRTDIRTVTVVDDTGDVLPAWVESAQFEKWVKP